MYHNLGELRKVCGKVRSTHMSGSTSKQVYLNFEENILIMSSQD